MSLIPVTYSMQLPVMPLGFNELPAKALVLTIVRVRGRKKEGISNHFRILIEIKAKDEIF